MFTLDKGNGDKVVINTSLNNAPVLDRPSLPELLDSSGDDSDSDTNDVSCVNSDLIRFELDF